MGEPFEHDSEDEYMAAQLAEKDAALQQAEAREAALRAALGSVLARDASTSGWCYRCSRWAPPHARGCLVPIVEAALADPSPQAEKLLRLWRWYTREDLDWANTREAIKQEVEG